MGIVFITTAGRLTIRNLSKEMSIPVWDPTPHSIGISKIFLVSFKKISFIKAEFLITQWSGGDTMGKILLKGRVKTKGNNIKREGNTLQKLHFP